MLDYESERATFHLDVPEHYNWVRDHVDRLVEADSRLAMLWTGHGTNDRRISFGEFSTAASRVCAVLRESGIRKGDRVALLLPRIPAWWEAVLGILKLGAISMPGTVLLTQKDLEYRLAVSGARGIITDREGASKVDRVASRLPELTAKFLTYDGYGQTETVALVANFPAMAVKPGSMGKPSPGFDVSVVDHDGEEIVGREGDIAVRVRPERPVGLFREYWRDSVATAQAIRGDWYVTGDRAIRDADGYFWFVGRADDVIISAGYRIGPFEVESALIEHPSVAESAVVASPDALRGHVVKAFVVLRPGVEATEALAVELQDHVRAVTAPYKYPRLIEFVADLPKTVSGKIRRNDLRAREERRVDASPDS